MADAGKLAENGWVAGWGDFAGPSLFRQATAGKPAR
jgi:hypothetical protein